MTDTRKEFVWPEIGPKTMREILEKEARRSRRTRRALTDKENRDGR